MSDKKQKPGYKCHYAFNDSQETDPNNDGMDYCGECDSWYKCCSGEYDIQFHSQFYPDPEWLEDDKPLTTEASLIRRLSHDFISCSNCIISADAQGEKIYGSDWDGRLDSGERFIIARRIFLSSNEMQSAHVKSNSNISSPRNERTHFNHQIHPCYIKGCDNLKKVDQEP